MKKIRLEDVSRKKMRKARTHYHYFMVLLALILVISCTQTPTVVGSLGESPSQVSANNQPGQQTSFKIKSTEGDAPKCLSRESYHVDNNLSGRYLLPLSYTRANGDSHNKTDGVANGDLKLVRNDDGDYSAFVYAYGYSGPYGYHLRVNSDEPIAGPIKSGDVRTFTFADQSSAFADNSTYQWGSSSVTDHDVLGSGTLTFTEDSVSVELDGLMTMTKSATIYGTSTAIYKSGGGSLSGNMVFRLPFDTCPEVELTADKEMISPANEDGQEDTVKFDVRSTTGKTWNLSVTGNKPGPVDERGLPTVGASCTWSTSGTEPEKEVSWNGKCNDGSYMVDGQYAVELTSDDFSDEASIMLDNTPPVFGELTVSSRADGRVQYSIDVEDPVVNGVSSGLRNVDAFKAELNGEPVQISDATLEEDGFQITSAGQKKNFTFTYSSIAPLSLLGLDILANIGRSNGDPRLLKFSCKGKGFGGKDIRLSGVSDYDQDVPGSKRAITLFLIADNPIADNKNKTRFFGDTKNTLKRITITSSTGEGGNLLPNQIVGVTPSSVKLDSAFDAVRGVKKVNGKVVGVYNASPLGLGLRGAPVMLHSDQLLYVLSPDLNNTSHRDQVLTIIIPTNRGGSVFFQVKLEKGDYQTWSKASCL